MTTDMFTLATREQLYARLAIDGPSGAGKTYTAIMTALGLAEGGKVAVLDTEHGSARKYAGEFGPGGQFFVLELTDFHPDKYVAAIQSAVANGYKAIVLDSLSHAWQGKHGMLELVAEIDQRKYHGNSDRRAWNDAKPIENRLIEALVGSPIHIIATMRTKTEYVTETDERTGKQRTRKLGLAPVQRHDMEYEFDIVLDMDQENTAQINKSRCSALQGALIRKPGAEFVQTLKAWLDSGEAREARAAATTFVAAAPEDSYEYDDAPPPEPPADDVPMAGEQQKASIRKLCTMLNKPEPDYATLTSEEARTLINRLSTAYQAQRRAEDAEDSGSHAAPPVAKPVAKPAAKPATRTAPPADHQGPDKAGPAIAGQLSSIRNLCKLTGEQEPTGPMTFQEAAGLIGKLSELYKTQKAKHAQSGAGAAGASSPAGGSSAHAAPPAKAPATAPKVWQLLGDAKLIVALGNHHITGAEAVEAWAAKADAIYSDQEGMDLQARCYALLETMEASSKAEAKAGA